MATTPHASWAKVYDTAYAKAFGSHYEALTRNTASVVRRKCPPPAALIDFGAGTGRLAIPLAQEGYTVTAVEPCPEMLDELRAKDTDRRVTTVISSMQDFHAGPTFDVALCVFTVLLYLLDREALRSALQAAATCLRPGGWLLLDVPSRQAFNSRNAYPSPGFRRSWQVNAVTGEPDVYEYTEDLRITGDNGAEKHYQDRFRIRYWPEDLVLQDAQDFGLMRIEGPLPEFAATGSSYFWLQKHHVTD